MLEGVVYGTVRIVVVFFDPVAVTLPMASLLIYLFEYAQARTRRQGKIPVSLRRQTL